MFNSHETLHIDNGDEASHEHQPLLSSSTNPTAFINQQYPPNFILSNDQYKASCESTLQQNSQPTYRTEPKFRKTRDRYLDSDEALQTTIGNQLHRLRTNTQDVTIIPSRYSHHPHADNYALSRVGGSSAESECSMSIGEFRDRSPTSYINYTIQPGDTLQNLSVRYSCPIASVKRLNSIWSDQDFFGLSKIRLPAGRLRLIEEIVQEGPSESIETQNVGSSYLSERSSTPWEFGQSKNSLDANRSEQSNLPHSNDYLSYDQLRRSSSASCDELFCDQIRPDFLFRNLDINIERARTAAKSYNESGNALMQTLAESGNIVDETDFSEANKVVKKESETVLNDLSDFGLSYNFLLLFIFIVCLVCPLAYVIYLEETHRDQNHHNYRQEQHHEQL